MDQTKDSNKLKSAIQFRMNQANDASDVEQDLGDDTDADDV